jgi:hypothetical protein
MRYLDLNGDTIMTVPGDFIPKLLRYQAITNRLAAAGLF